MVMKLIITSWVGGKKSVKEEHQPTRSKEEMDRMEALYNKTHPADMRGTLAGCCDSADPGRPASDLQGN